MELERYKNRIYVSKIMLIIICPIIIPVFFFFGLYLLKYSISTGLLMLLFSVIFFLLLIGGVHSCNKIISNIAIEQEEIRQLNRKKYDRY